MTKLNGELYVGETGRKLKDLGGGSPIGTIEIFSGSTAPEGYLFCQGQAVSRTTYAELFEAIGTTYGTGDGSTTFNLPNLKGRIPVGQDTSDTDFDVLGETGGSKTNTHWHYQTVSFDGNDTYITQSGNTGGSRVVTRNRMVVSSAKGNGTARQDGTFTETINILQPYVVLNYIIKAYNVASSAPVTSQVKNSYSESVTDVYSCDYVNGIIDSGSNANGNYIKYADGTMICYREIESMMQITGTWGVLYYAENTTQYNFAQEFIEIPKVLLNLRPTSSGAAFLGYYNEPIITKTYFQRFAALRPSARQNTPIALMIYAIGKWK